MTGGPKRVNIRADCLEGPIPENLANSVRNLLEGNIASVGQQFTMTRDGREILLTVTGMDAPGLITMRTEISLMWMLA
jgi:hypothetical protein